MKKKDVLWVIPTILKYILACILILLAVKTAGDKRYIVGGVCELGFIFLLFEQLKQKSMLWEILHSIVLFFFNVWTGVVFFGSSYVTLVMLENLVSLQDLIGKVVSYLGLVIIVLILSFFPGRPILPFLCTLTHERGNRILDFLHKVFGNLTKIAPLMLLLDLLIMQASYFACTPAAGLVSLYQQYENHKQLEAMMTGYADSNADTDISALMASLNGAAEADAEETEAPKEPDPIETVTEETASADADVSEETEEKTEETEAEEEDAGPTVTSAHGLFGSNVNVIVIFTEGLSRNVIFDERNIMPNVKNFSSQTINFTNYYNHTFATYRGIQGQLYSGYSLNDQDSNHLPSIMDTLRSAGYYSTFINTEPYNDVWTTYLNAMSFDQVISDGTNAAGPLSSLTDEQAYEQVLNQANALNAAGTKFFLACYTFGTHASFDSADQIFGDGSDAELNKFYNADYWFGWFINEFKNSALAENTVLVFTTDHSTYADNDFTGAFPAYARPCSDCDEIPLFIYYKGQTQTVDAAGRNSLDFAPTLLDLLGLDSPSTFLGASLYTEKGTESYLDTFFWDSSYLCYTGGDSIEKDLSESLKSAIYQQISAYFSSK